MLDVQFALPRTTGAESSICPATSVTPLTLSRMPETSDLGERQVRARPARAAHDAHRARKDNEHVGAERLDLAIDFTRGAGADGDQDDDRRHADDDAERGQNGPQEIDPERAHGDEDAVPEGHHCASVGSADRRLAHVVDDMAVAEGDPAAGPERDFRLVGHDDDGDPRPVEVGEHLHDLVGRAAVEGARRLVRKQELRIVDERAGDGDALLLAAGQLPGRVIHAIAEADLLQALLRHLDAVGGPRMGVEQRQHHLVECRRARQQIELLEYEADGSVAQVRQFIDR